MYAASLLKLSPPIRSLFCYIQCRFLIKNTDSKKLAVKKKFKIKTWKKKRDRIEREKWGRGEFRIQKSHSIQKSKKSVNWYSTKQSQQKVKKKNSFWSLSFFPRYKKARVVFFNFFFFILTSENRVKKIDFCFGFIYYFHLVNKITRPYYWYSIVFGVS